MQDQSIPSISIPLYARDNKTVRGYTIIDTEDCERASRYNWRMVVIPNSDLRYACRTDYSSGRARHMALHRVLTDAPTNVKVDHVNGNGLDNRKSNLRFASHGQNMANRKMHSNNHSGYKGVYWAGGKRRWRAGLRHKGKKLELGTFVDPRDAAYAYNRAAHAIFGEFARLNDLGGYVPSEWPPKRRSPILLKADCLHAGTLCRVCKVECAALGCEAIVEYESMSAREDAGKHLHRLGWRLTRNRWICSNHTS